MSLAATHLPWGADLTTSWIALLVINVTSPTGYPSEKYFAGAFVGRSWFLTSASCLEPLPEPYQVTVMTVGQDFACAQHERWAFTSVGLEFELHPGYSERSYVDLAMVRTRRTVFHVPEVKLNSSPHLKRDSKCRLLSFEEKHPQRKGDSLPAGFISVKTAECLSEVQEGRICTESGDTSVREMNICPGKLGALLECNGKLTGVLTQPQMTSIVCDLAGHLQHFEDVSKHQNWILDTIEEAYDLIYDEGPPKGWKDMDDEKFADLMKEDELWTAHLDFEKKPLKQASVDERDVEDMEEKIRGHHNESDMEFSQDLNLLISTIVLCSIFLLAAFYFCYVQLQRFDHQLTI
ncbi:hypothetical protein LSTR_LSTR008265 [Laodelphax striatellus]|uniref:Peptidase S1 domain-containing protein n=1 Tax=Laodelphax striatellus TaxID=195883 RepID=A0A482XMH3_LAOST|nr:hypothetical protein LSTR_LSTR008265 [Laodelphax striatellus]